MSMFAHSVANLTTKHSPVFAGHPPLDFLTAALPPMLAYNTISLEIMVQLPPCSTVMPNAYLFSQVIYPYNAEAFE